MKVVVYESCEVNEEQLKKIADLLDGVTSARRALRSEAKVFIWQWGEDWAPILDSQWEDEFGPGTPFASPAGNSDEDEDLPSEDLDPDEDDLI